jgi:hypothetical protein
LNSNYLFWNRDFDFWPKNLPDEFIQIYRIIKKSDSANMIKFWLVFISHILSSDFLWKFNIVSYLTFVTLFSCSYEIFMFILNCWISEIFLGKLLIKMKIVFKRNTNCFNSTFQIFVSEDPLVTNPHNYNILFMPG